MRARFSTSAFGLILLIVVCTGVGTALPSDVIRVGPFSEADPAERYPPDWSLFEMAYGHKQTTYDLVESARGTVVRARTEGGMSALSTERRFDLSTHPILEWHWKIDRLPEINVTEQARNDVPAAVVVTFAHDELSLPQHLRRLLVSILGYHIVPNRTLIYFWGNHLQPGSVRKGLVIDWQTKIAVHSGSTDVGSWVPERRNVRKDYQALFGEAPPPVTSVALTTETNNTGAKVTAYYGDVVFRAAADSLLGPPVDTPRTQP